MRANFPTFIALVWPPDGDFDSPRQGYHTTSGDAGGGTFGGVIEATWQACVARGLVAGELRNATLAQLQTVLRAECWGDTCDALPPGVDVIVANGRMMSGQFPALFEQCLGWTGADVDNDIGPNDLAAAGHSDPATLIRAVHGRHYDYLCHDLSPADWTEFGGGWTRRLEAARDAALRVAAA